MPCRRVSVARFSVSLITVAFATAYVRSRARRRWRGRRPSLSSQPPRLGWTRPFSVYSRAFAPLTHDGVSTHDAVARPEVVVGDEVGGDVCAVAREEVELEDPIVACVGGVLKVEIVPRVEVVVEVM